MSQKVQAHGLNPTVGARAHTLSFCAATQDGGNLKSRGKTAWHVTSLVRYILQCPHQLLLRLAMLLCTQSTEQR